MAASVQIKKGELLFREGDFADCMYIVSSGEFDVVINQGPTETAVARYGPGHLIGEMSLFDKKPRSATIRAAQDSAAVILPYDKLEEQLRTMPDWVQVTLKTLSEKIRLANSQLLSTVQNGEKRNG